LKTKTSQNNQNNERNRPVELFLFLGDLCKNLRPKLPVDYKKASITTDCLKEIEKRLDCGGGTLDLTTRKLVGNNPLQLSEVTERSSGGFCGSAFVDKEFIAFT
ncbi:hypothetical protein RhiirA1_446740, partial [Rhizophagus irregularis]